MFKFNNRNTKIRCEICSKLTIKTLRRFAVFIVNFEHIPHLVLVILIFSVLVIVNFEQVNAGWV